VVERQVQEHYKKESGLTDLIYLSDLHFFLACRLARPLKSDDGRKPAWIQKVVRMKLFLLILVALTGLIQGSSLANDSNESFNGHLISEPKLPDYVKAERTPGFSSITDIQDAEGRPVRN
jgi:hypothetical protein